MDDVVLRSRFADQRQDGGGGSIQVHACGGSCHSDRGKGKENTGLQTLSLSQSIGPAWSPRKLLMVKGGGGGTRRCPSGSPRRLQLQRSPSPYKGQDLAGKAAVAQRQSRAVSPGTVHKGPVLPLRQLKSSRVAQGPASARSAQMQSFLEDDDCDLGEDEAHRLLWRSFPQEAANFERIALGKYIVAGEQVELKILSSCLLVTTSSGEVLSIDSFVEAFRTRENVSPYPNSLLDSMTTSPRLEAKLVDNTTPRLKANANSWEPPTLEAQRATIRGANNAMTAAIASHRDADGGAAEVRQVSADRSKLVPEPNGSADDSCASTGTDTSTKAPKFAKQARTPKSTSRSVRGGSAKGTPLRTSSVISSPSGEGRSKSKQAITLEQKRRLIELEDRVKKIELVDKVSPDSWGASPGRRLGRHPGSTSVPPASPQALR